MNDNTMGRFLEFFGGMTKEERRTLHPLLVIANEILAKLVEEDEDERPSDF